MTATTGPFGMSFKTVKIDTNAFCTKNAPFMNLVPHAKLDQKQNNMALECDRIVLAICIKFSFKGYST